MNHHIKFINLLFMVFLIIAGCSNLYDKDTSKVTNDSKKLVIETEKKEKPPLVLIDDNGKLGDLFKSSGDEIGSVNKYLWQASLEVLSFLPINSADPFSGVIAFGKGKAPGSSQTYDATVYITDPALDARSLNVTVRTVSGTISSAARREIESAILSRARQIRLKALKL